MRLFPFVCSRRAAAYLAGGAFASLLVLAGCSRAQSATAGAAPKAMPVTVLTVTPEPVTLSRELPGRTSPYRVAEVRARINGIVLKRLFTEGADVKEGDVLFEIDPAPYQAALDSAKATLARAKASFASAKAQAERYEGLVATNAISKQTYDDAVASRQSLKAEVAAGEAAVRAAEINLGYTHVTSPISGRIGRAMVTEGAYVQQSTATLLATVQQVDPLYVDLARPADEVLALRAALASGKLKHTDDGQAKLTILLDGDKPYPTPGALQFSDVTVDPTTSMVTLRGTVPNPHMDLLPGMFVRARLDEGTDPSAILLPQNLVSRNTHGDATTLVVGADNKVELRLIQADRAIGNKWLITGGLSAGDRVIADNLQKIRPGAVVEPVAPAAAPSTAAASAN